MRIHERRPGFTLIELLVVMTIMAVLAAIATGVYFKFIDVQQKSNNDSQLSKVRNLLRQRMNAENDLIKSEIKSGKVSALLSVAPWNTLDQRTAEIVYAKLRMRQAFPMTFAEVWNLPSIQSPFPSLPPFVDYLKKQGIYSGNVNLVPEASESAVCLLLALQRGTSGGDLTADDLGSAATADVSWMGSKLRGLVDGYGNPIAFCRWPTGSSELNPNGPLPGISNDPSDPEGQLLKLQGASLTTFVKLCHNLPPTT